METTVMEEGREFEHENMQGCVLTAKSSGNCLILNVPEGWRMVVQDSKDTPGRLAWVWMEREHPHGSED
jgi:hypothetical protein